MRLISRSSAYRWGRPARPAHSFGLAAGLALAAALGTAVAGCATSAPTSSAAPGSGPAGAKITVVAAEDFWGSIARQLGGDRVAVKSIISNPAADPHDYEPTAADARVVAGARLVIDNGVGYDPWAARLVAADPSADRTTLTVGDLVGARDGDNPHRWYNPADVAAVASTLTADYRRLDPAGAAYYDRQATAFEGTGLKQYHAVIAQIRRDYAGMPVGASESIFAMMAPALGLKLVTPPSFLRAISSGTDPTAADKTTIDTQIRTRQIKVYVYNSQNATPDVARQVAEAKAAGIPVTTITETLVPAGATFQQWQVAQLDRLRTALALANGR